MHEAALTEVTAAIRQLLREVAPQVLGVIVRRYRDFAACEDAVQEAFIAAATQWPHEGMPEHPRAWLILVASRRITDHVRAEAARQKREALGVSLVPPDEQIALAADQAGTTERDDTLDLLFLCCHPALSPVSAIALTLRAVGGLTTAEIARAFLVPEATMAQRISRAKQSIKASGTGFEMKAAELSTRLGSVLHALYLMFSEGYAASSGHEALRTDLSGEAMRLTRLLHGLVPDEPEVAGLLALMLLTDARRAARTGPAGEIIPLDQQDRSLWDRAAIAEGVALISATLPQGRVGPYQLQAAVAAVHDEAPSAADCSVSRFAASTVTASSISFVWMPSPSSPSFACCTPSRTTAPTPTRRCARSDSTCRFDWSPTLRTAPDGSAAIR